ncbi:zinc finger and BTB domain-containing protein 26-like [Sipha flava]|uniref:Zinc finger and BTB domain-containing protein 26-like n=1 Tax=Sipha flava TaxID=143950 RepID=A0A8B8GEL2_9HEMI|nr:zinc finger and BTB domain-containing protein 26-like [Sipha flava]
MDNFVFSDVLHNNILKNRRHLCPNGCGRHYKRRCLMNYNLKFECDNQDMFICPNVMCSRTYKFKRNLNRHLRHECGGQKRFNCSICPKAFSQKITLKKHLILIHNCI